MELIVHDNFPQWQCAVNLQPDSYWNRSFLENVFWLFALLFAFLSSSPWSDAYDVLLLFIFLVWSYALPLHSHLFDHECNLCVYSFRTHTKKNICATSSLVPMVFKVVSFIAHGLNHPAKRATLWKEALKLGCDIYVYKRHISNSLLPLLFCIKTSHLYL